MHEALERIVSRGTAQLVRCLELLADGQDDASASRALGVSKSRISQLRQQARRIADHCC